MGSFRSAAAVAALSQADAVSGMRSEEEIKEFCKYFPNLKYDSSLE